MLLASEPESFLRALLDPGLVLIAAVTGEFARTRRAVFLGAIGAAAWHVLWKFLSSQWGGFRFDDEVQAIFDPGLISLAIVAACFWAFGVYEIRRIRSTTERPRKGPF